MKRLPVLLLLMGAQACSGGSSGDPDPQDPIPDSDPGQSAVANVTAVSASGSPGQYNFAVTIQSPDTGCELYANWWEVVSADGELLYRRILAHSHVDEQPFTRSGGPVDVTADDQLTIRAHIHATDATDPETYGGIEFVGSVSAGFVAADSRADIPPAVENADPQPTGCAF